MSALTFIPKVIYNRIMILLKLDAEKEVAGEPWRAFKYNPAKTLQQNAGFSHTPEMDETLQRIKAKLVKTLRETVATKGTILDFGCGPGIYMDMLKNYYNVVGVDISGEMLQVASALLPTNRFYHGNFFEVKFDEKFSAVYSIGVLEYVPVSRLERFFRKCSDLLDDGGMLFIQYPHALRIRDLLYPNLKYINYSPKLIQRVAAKYFSIVENAHCFDGRPACLYDREPYPTTSRIFKNGYILIAKKKVIPA